VGRVSRPSKHTRGFLEPDLQFQDEGWIMTKHRHRANLDSVDQFDTLLSGELDVGGSAVLKDQAYGKYLMFNDPESIHHANSEFAGTIGHITCP